MEFSVLVMAHSPIVTSKAMNWETKLQNWCDTTGASHAGVTSLSEPKTWPYYEKWLELGYHGKMGYLKDHAPYKKSPQTWIPLAQSAFVFAFPYVPHPEEKKIFRQARTSLYSHGRDYHHWMKEKLVKIIEHLSQEFPEHSFYVHTDSSPILERDLAAKAGLGWFGKNTCLIHPKRGSLFLLGEIISTLKVETVHTPLSDFCGQCTRCLDVCPTGALKSPRILQADLCISYWTIESRDLPPENLRPLFGDWLFGCDLCQTACPWNQKAHKPLTLQVESRLKLSDEERTSLVEDLKQILTESNNQLQKRLKGTALARAGAKGLKRNALVVAANQNLVELVPIIEDYTAHEYFGPLAQWSLEQLELHKKTNS